METTKGGEREETLSNNEDLYTPLRKRPLYETKEVGKEEIGFCAEINGLRSGEAVNAAQDTTG